MVRRIADLTVAALVSPTGRMWWSDEQPPSDGAPETQLERHLRRQHAVRPSERWALTPEGRAEGIAAGWQLPEWALQGNRDD